MNEPRFHIGQRVRIRNHNPRIGDVAGKTGRIVSTPHAGQIPRKISGLPAANEMAESYVVGLDEPDSKEVPIRASDLEALD